MSKMSEKMQNFIMSNPKRAIWFMTHMSADFWRKKGEKMALEVFHEAAEKSPAYRDFLKKQKVNPKEIKTIEDFKEKVPITSKKDFLHQYSLVDLTGKKFGEAFGICFSSGSTGIPTPFVYRRKLFFLAFQGWLAWLDYMWDICSPTKTTLFINAAPLGAWSFGYTTNLLVGRVLGEYNITYITTGCDSQMVLKILKEIGENYTQVIISTIPSFLRKVLDEGDEQKLKWEGLNLKLQLAGEYLSEDLQDYILSKIDPERKEVWRIFNLFAAGDTGLIGFASPLPVIIQKITKRNEKFRAMLFGQNSSFSLFQYNPLSVFLEEKENNLLVTTINSLVPIIRYKLGDLAKIISFSEMEEKLKSCGYTIPALLEKEGWKKGYFKWPFLIFQGRSDDMITIFSGAKISAQNLFPLLAMPEAKEIKSFKITTEDDENQNKRFLVYLELKPNLKPASQEIANLEKKYQNLVHQCLLKTSIDYQDAYKIDSERVLPQVKIFLSGQGPFKDDLSRPKPKMVI